MSLLAMFDRAKAATTSSEREASRAAKSIERATSEVELLEDQIPVAG